MSIFYIIKNRLCPDFGTKLWFKTWAKRAWTLGGLVRVECMAYYWRFRGVRLGELSSVGCDQLYVPSRLTVGMGTFIGRADIQLLAPVVIGNNVIISDGVRLITGSHDPQDIYLRHILAPIEIDDYAWIATGAIILPGVKIGRGAIVGAGAVVSRSVDPFTIVVGNPARAVKNRRAEKLDYRPNLFRACYEAWLGCPKPK